MWHFKHTTRSEGFFPNGSLCLLSVLQNTSQPNVWNVGNTEYEVLFDLYFLINFITATWNTCVWMSQLAQILCLSLTHECAVVTRWRYVADFLAVWFSSNAAAIKLYFSDAISEAEETLSSTHRKLALLSAFQLIWHHDLAFNEETKPSVSLYSDSANHH